MFNAIRRDLALQLLGLYLFFVGPVVVGSLYFDYYTSQRLQADVKASDLALARAIAEETNTIVDSALQAIRQLATYRAVIESDPEGMEVIFRTILNVRPDVNLVYRLDERGIMVYHYPTEPGSTVGWDFSHRDYYQAALTTRDPILSQGRISPTTEQPVATAVSAIWSADGQFMGLVGTNIKLHTLSHTLAAIAAEHRPEEGFNVVILDVAGKIIAHPNPSFLLTDFSAVDSQVKNSVLRGTAGNLIDQNQDGKEVLYSFVPISRSGWGVIVSRPVQAAFTTPRYLHQGVIISVTLFLVIGLFFWLALSRRVLKPLERLGIFSQRIGRDESLPAEQRRGLNTLSRRSDQIGDLCRSLIRMEAAIAARLNELSTLLETSAAVVSSLDSNILLERILDQVARLMGIQRCAIVSLDEQMGHFRIKASRGLSKRYAEMLDIDPGEPLSLTIQAIKTGKPVQISDTELDLTFPPIRSRARLEGHRSLLAVPLQTLHTPPTALIVYRPDPHVFTEREINLLTSFANHAAMAIENAALYASSDMRLQEQTRRLEALVQSMEDGLILEDLQGRVVYANRRINEIVSLPPIDAGETTVDKLIDHIVALSDDSQKTRAELESIYRKRGQRSLEIKIHGSRSPQYLNLKVFDVTDSRGMLLGRGHILQDITQARELDRMKSSLVSTVSHELRTPLAAIKGYATTLLAEDVQWDPESEREFIQIISNETDRLNKLVDDLLDMSRIEAGSLLVSKVPCDLTELVAQVVEKYPDLARERIRLDLPPGFPRIYADPERLGVVLRNIIENAVKYAGDGSPIIISGSVTSSSIVVRIQDEGPGIPMEYSQRVFERFYRIGNTLTSPAPGAGLGLAIARGFIHAHGGDIWLEPSSTGACIAFSLPLPDHSEQAESRRPIEAVEGAD
jgi:signal transduction histidine kinase/HAMP domain-containing protein